MEIQVNEKSNKLAESPHNFLKITQKHSTNFMQNKLSLMPKKKKHGIERIPTNLKNAKDVFTMLIISNSETKWPNKICILCIYYEKNALDNYK